MSPSELYIDDDGRGLLSYLPLHRCEVGAVDPKYVILIVDTDATYRAGHPSIGKRFWPIWIDEKARHVAFGGAGEVVKIGRHQSRKSENARKHILPDSHALPLPKSFVRQHYQAGGSCSMRLLRLQRADIWGE